jgi:FKBP-type peptidyl-prolyl cis-trans isomerase FkpA/FKBP-type peptidyl-prolyl cis-trans isomerase FklB
VPARSRGGGSTAGLAPRPKIELFGGFDNLISISNTTEDTALRSVLSTRSTVAALSLALLAACSPEPAEPGAGASLETDDQKASYGIGHNIGRGLAPMADRIDLNSMARGLRDAMDEAEPAVPEEELQEILATFQLEMQQAQQAKMTADAEENLAVADSFMTGNAEREGVQTTESGLQYEVLEPGDGPSPGPEDQVTVHYRGTLPDGTPFDSSYDRGEPATFAVRGVIPGFAEGLQLMSVGSKYRLYIPPELGYGPQGSGPIPPNSALIFELELLEIG